MSDDSAEREKKLLADILGLVLEDQPGQAEAALAALRRRARAEGITGGALKNLFRRMTGAAEDGETLTRPHPEPVPAPLLAAQLDAARLRAASLNEELQKTRAELEAMASRATEERTGARFLVRGLSAAALVLVVAVAGLGFLLLRTLPFSPRQPLAAAIPPALSEPAAAPTQHVAAPAPPPPIPQPEKVAAHPAQSLKPTYSVPPASIPSAANRFTPAEQRALMLHLRQCWLDHEPERFPRDATVQLHVMTNAEGTVKVVQIADADFPRLAEPLYRRLANRARKAVLDPRCSTLPLPASMLGRPQAIDITLTP